MLCPFSLPGKSSGSITRQEIAANPDHFERLVQEFAELAPEERARRIAAVAHRAKSARLGPRFQAPTLSGGSVWIAGDMRREEIYGDDGR